MSPNNELPSTIFSMGHNSGEDVEAIGIVKNHAVVIL
jgi:hypothetical protein